MDGISKSQQRKARRRAEGKTTQCRSARKLAMRNDSPHVAARKMQRVHFEAAMVEAERQRVEADRHQLEYEKQQLEEQKKKVEEMSARIVRRSQELRAKMEREAAAARARREAAPAEKAHCVYFFFIANCPKSLLDTALCTVPQRQTGSPEE